MVSFMYACTTCLKNAPDKPHRDDRNAIRETPKKLPEKPQKGPPDTPQKTPQRAPERPLFETLSGAKMYGFPSEIQQFCNIDEIIESIDAPKFKYFHRNMKDYENQMGTTKKRDSKNAYNYIRF